MTSVRSLMVMPVREIHHKREVLHASASRGLVLTERPRLRDRLAARWRPRRLDRALAAGTPPEASAALALRAQRLTEPHCLHSISQALHRIVREAREGRGSSATRVMPYRSRVMAASEELSLLADMLDEPGPVAAGGVAEVWLLLTDGTGPLYNPHTDASLRAGAARAARELRSSVGL
jgi:hypothetical protein